MVQIDTSLARNLVQELAEGNKVLSDVDHALNGYEYNNRVVPRKAPL